MRTKNSEYAKVLVHQAYSEGFNPKTGIQELADKTSVTCRDPDCGRNFRGLRALQEHAESVHTFNDIQRMLSEVVREKYGKPYSDGNPGTYVWVEDVSDDWVVFCVEAPKDSSLQKASYSIDGTDVTLGESTEVVRRTVYEAVAKKA